MIERTLDDLAQDLADRRRLGEPPPVVLLGAGASVEAGIGALGALFRFVGVPDFRAFVAYIEARNENERYRLLADFLQTQDPFEVTPGYAALAELCATAFFDVVLTTNLDPLLDDALATARLRRRDCLLLINGILRPDRLRVLLTSRSPRVKVLKLHGDLFHRFMAWTPAEMERYVDDLKPTLRPALYGRDFLVVGSSVRDPKIRELVIDAGGAVWFVSPAAVPEELAGLKDLRAVVGANMTFEHVFTRLGAALAAGGTTRPAVGPRDTVVSTEVPPGGGALTMDDLMASVVGVALGPDATPAMTGFLLAEPRLIVTDGYARNAGLLEERPLTLVTGAGQRLETRTRRLVRRHLYGPWVLEAPRELQGPGLRLDSRPLGAGEAVHVAVGAGTAVGVSSGPVVTGKEEPAKVAGQRRAERLVHVRCAVRPGASGAPVVDSRMSVLAFVVAGSSDPQHPDTFVYPAHRWARDLHDGSPPAPRSVARTRRKPGTARSR